MFLKGFAGPRSMQIPLSDIVDSGLAYPINVPVDDPTYRSPVFPGYMMIRLRSSSKAISEAIFPPPGRKSEMIQLSEVQDPWSQTNLSPPPKERLSAGLDVIMRDVKTFNKFAVDSTWIGLGFPRICRAAVRSE